MDQPLRIRLLGGFAVRVGAEPVAERAWRLRKAKSLLKLLALSPERRVHRELATELLWSDRDADAAANNFHQALYVARRALEGAGADRMLELSEDMLALVGAVDVDVDAFERAAAHALETGQLSDYRAALELHGGELLPEDRFEAWTTARREAVAETQLALLLGLAERHADEQAAIAALEQAVVIDPLHEPAHRALMRLFAATGRRQQALAQYHLLREALRRELEADPDPQTAALYQALLRGEVEVGSAAARPAPRRRAAREPERHNLPVALTSFIGRERELTQVARLLERERLVTLTGAGGSGKTRLALETARGRTAAYRDGVWLVELAGVSDAAWVPATVAATVGLSLHSERPDVDALCAFLGGWEALLIVDNCEHLVGACARLAERLLSSCPQLRLLTTSREPLRVPGEATWRVPSLKLPTGDDDVAASESVRLFCERAHSVAPGFTLEPAVAEICRRLDGMPLALELAAARVGALSPAQIAGRLGDSLSVLTAGSRAVLDRQETLRATLRWSEQLLSDAERAEFRRLAVFAGSFTLDGAEAVTSGDGIEQRDVADLLARLVDKSLVAVDDGYRYRVLEPTRQYAHERLVASGEAHAVEERHHAFYLGLARSADPERRRRRLEPDHDNLRAALAWALREDPEQALRLAVEMWPMWMAGSYFREGSRWLEATLAAARAPTLLRAEGLRAAAALAIRLGDTRELTRLGDERVAIFRRLGNRTAVAHALDEAGVYEYMVGSCDRAERLYEESRALGDHKVAAAVLHSSAVLAHSRADLERAREALLESLALLRDLPGDDREPFFRVHSVGLFVGPDGPRGAPRIHLEETAQFFTRVDARHAVGYVLAALGDVARAQGMREPARERLTESLGHFREERDATGTAFALNRLGNFAGAAGDYELGREWLEEALEIRRELGDRRGVGITLANMGVLAARAGRGGGLVDDALALFEQTDDAPGVMGARLAQGNIAAAAGDVERARALLDTARELADRQLLRRASGWAALRLAELELGVGDAGRAARHVAAALERLRPLGDRWGVARALELDQAGAKRSLSRVGDG